MIDYHQTTAHYYPNLAGVMPVSDLDIIDVEMDNLGSGIGFYGLGVDSEGIVYRLVWAATDEYVAAERVAQAREWLSYYNDMAHPDPVNVAEAEIELAEALADPAYTGTDILDDLGRAYDLDNPTLIECIGHQD